MTRLFASGSLVSVLVGVALLVSGCGGSGKGVKVEGRIVRDGQPYAATTGETLNLAFVGKGAQGAEATYPAKINPDGSFVADGPGGKGIPPGSYKINLNATLEGSDPDSLARMENINQQFVQINGKECQLTGEPNQKITIDVAKGTIGK